MTQAQGKNMGPQGKSTRVRTANTKSWLTFSFTTDTDEVSGVTWKGCRCRIWWKWHVIVDSTAQQKSSDLRIRSRVNIDFDNGTRFKIFDFACCFAIGQTHYLAHVHPYHCENAGYSQHYPSQSIFPPPCLFWRLLGCPSLKERGKLGLSVALSLSFSKPADEHTCRTSPETCRLCIPLSYSSTSSTSLSGRRTEGISHRRSTRMRSVMGPVQEGTASMH